MKDEKMNFHSERINRKKGFFNEEMKYPINYFSITFECRWGQDTTLSQSNAGMHYVNFGIILNNYSKRIDFTENTDGLEEKDLLKPMSKEYMLRMVDVVVENFKKELIQKIEKEYKGEKDNERWNM